MAEVTFYADSISNEVTDLPKLDAVYSTARDSATSDSASAIAPTIGQKFISSEYTVHRGTFCFDTSGLDDTALILGAILTIRRTSANQGLGTVMLKNGMPTYPHIPAVVGDYDRTHYSGNGGTGSFGATVELIITLNSTGRSWINKTGYTKFMMMSQNDIDGTAPTANEWAQFYASGDYKPKIVVTYYLPTGSPTVTSVGPCIDRQSTTMTAVGNITDDGDGYEARGFEYYEDTGNIYDSEMYAVRELGVFVGTGNYEMTIYGLKPETTYQIRAWVKNIYGLVYGEWYTCITTAVLAPSYGMYEEENTATICFYVRKVGGKWSIKHGPYTTDQTDIEITKILTEGTGKYQIKFESDVLTGISASVMCKVDIKAR